LNDLRRLESDMRVVAARLDVGLSVIIEPKRDLRVDLQTDDEEPTHHDLSADSFETWASRTIALDVEGVAKIVIAGGAADARDEMDRLDRRWSADSEPLLQSVGAANLDELARMVNDARTRADDIQTARGKAAQFDQRIADQPDWASLLAECQRQLAESENTLSDADGSKAEKAARRLRLTTPAEVEKQTPALREKIAALTTGEQQRGAELAAENARMGEKQAALETAGADLRRAQSLLDGDWGEVRREVLNRRADIKKELQCIEDELRTLTIAEHEGLAAAQKGLEACTQVLELAKGAHRLALDSLDRARLAQANGQGSLETLRDVAAKLDPDGAREALKQLEHEFEAVPAARQPVNGEVLTEARRKFDEARSRLGEIDEAIQEKRGALQLVGGDVARQRAEEASRELRSAQEREQLTEIEYQAWELLRQTLREAEQAESAHLGHALAEPIARRFGSLTDGRYGALGLGSNLETRGISIAGGDRPVRLLSAGTKDQLSIIFRLTVAEQLKSVIVLDDQLRQSDTGRMAWLLDLLDELANNIQVIVFTCRPDDYCSGIEGRGAKALLSIRSVDLRRCIDRFESTSR
jgi:uncharacterized protein YhaN